MDDHTGKSLGLSPPSQRGRNRQAKVANTPKQRQRTALASNARQRGGWFLGPAVLRDYTRRRRRPPESSKQHDVCHNMPQPALLTAQAADGDWEEMTKAPYQPV